MTKEKETLLFKMNSETAYLFYKVCMECNADTEKERMQILMTMAKMGLMQSVSATARTREQIIKDYKKHYRVMDVRPEIPGDDTNGESK